MSGRRTWGDLLCLGCQDWPLAVPRPRLFIPGSQKLGQGLHTGTSKTRAEPERMWQGNLEPGFAVGSQGWFSETHSGGNNNIHNS